jgi:hypothetical protein
MEDQTDVSSYRHTTQKNADLLMHRMGFEPMIPLFLRFSAACVLEVVGAVVDGFVCAA